VLALERADSTLFASEVSCRLLEDLFPSFLDLAVSILLNGGMFDFSRDNLEAFEEDCVDKDLELTEVETDVKSTTTLSGLRSPMLSTSSSSTSLSSLPSNSPGASSVANEAKLEKLSLKSIVESDSFRSVSRMASFAGCCAKREYFRAKLSKLSSLCDGL
jgi:hypothetical protein